MSEPKSCPSCSHSFQGDPIPQEYIDAGYYGDATHYSTVIGIYDMWEDCTVRWKCPFCDYEWDRFPSSSKKTKKTKKKVTKTHARRRSNN